MQDYRMIGDPADGKRDVENEHGYSEAAPCPHGSGTRRRASRQNGSHAHIAARDHEQRDHILQHETRGEKASGDMVVQGRQDVAKGKGARVTDDVPPHQNGHGEREGEKPDEQQDDSGALGVYLPAEGAVALHADSRERCNSQRQGQAPGTAADFAEEVPEGGVRPVEHEPVNKIGGHGQDEHDHVGHGQVADEDVGNIAKVSVECNYLGGTKETINNELEMLLRMDGLEQPIRGQSALKRYTCIFVTIVITPNVLNKLP